MSGDRPAVPAAGHGVGNLLAEIQSARIPDPVLAADSKPTRPLPLPAWCFYAADVLLLLGALLIAVRSTAPLSPGTIFYCALTVGLGAALALVPQFFDLRGKAAATTSWTLADDVAPDGVPRKLVIHLRQPFFIAAVEKSVFGQITLTPLKVDGVAELPAVMKAQLLREATEFHSRSSQTSPKRHTPFSA